uniref:Metalloendopeptidase n=1 Tax=Strongyloides venezuelensis TaxID=75913 RepID=A0A0K0FES2_STRVS
MTELNNNIIKKALKEIENNTCIRFKENNLLNNNNKGIIFEKSKVCSSYVGLAFSNIKQTVNLTIECSNEKGYVLHEVGHALGLLHEHCRTDRDNFVTIDFNNIKTGLNGNFKIPTSVNYKNYSTHYDYGSIMHYNSYEFSTSYWRKVLTSKIHTEYDRMMGQRSYMTFNDYKKINLLYCSKCNKTGEKDKGKVVCLNGGYVDYKNCSRCICPFGYTGDLCSEIMKSDERCNKTTFNEIIRYSTIGLLVHIIVSFIYKLDKGTTGLLLCSWRYWPIQVKSESNTVLIYFNGAENNAFIQFGFKEVS